MDLLLPKFADWSRRGHELNHRWLDKLPDTIRGSEAIPGELARWPEEFPELLQWLDMANSALSPGQILDTAFFESWPGDFRAEARHWLDDRFMQSSPSLLRQLTKIRERLIALDNSVRSALTQSSRTMPLDTRLRLADELESVTKQLYASVPRRLNLPRLESDLPLVLVIDDVLGRTSVTHRNDCVLSSSAIQQVNEQRRGFCKRFNVIDVEAPSNSEAVLNAVARVYFCPGQGWDEHKGFCNDLQVVERWLTKELDASGKPAWALLIADVWFGIGEPRRDEWRAPTDTRFGLSDVIPLLLRRIPDIPLLAMTSDQSEDIQLGAKRAGIEYLHRSSSDYQELLHHIFASSQASNSQLRQALHLPDTVVAEDRKMLQAYFKAWRAAQDVHGKTVLILGETGSGKDRMAKYIHEMSPRGHRVFLSVNCATLQPTTAEGELFGALPGAWTDLHSETKGRFELADQGTLFLNEFPQLSSSIQTKLLEVLDTEEAKNRVIKRAGSPKSGQKLECKINVRVICGAIKEDLEHKLERQDLYFRIAHHVIEIPSLRDRRADIIPLARYYFEHQLHASGLRLDKSACDYLLTLDYPGNIRNLFQILQEASLGKGKTNIISEADVRTAWGTISGRLYYQRGANTAESVAAVVPVQTASLRRSDSEMHVRSEIGNAVAKILGYVESDSGWGALTQEDIEELDATLSGHVLEVVGALVEWSFHRGKDAPTIAKYLTGESTGHKAPEQVIKRFLKLDKDITDRIARSKHSVGDNKRLERIITTCRKEWERRRNAKPANAGSRSQ